jgi:predicted glycosyltransferase
VNNGGKWQKGLFVASLDRKQPRLLFFVHDGAGLGHLTRLSRVAAGLQGYCACLFVTGHRAGCWIIPEACEFVHLPSRDSLLKKRSAYWNRKPFLSVGRAEALALREALFHTVLREFSPDALVVDHLPLGTGGELLPLLASLPERKYLMLRGVLDSLEQVKEEVFDMETKAIVENQFTRILVASDEGIFDIEKAYSSCLSPAILKKVSYVGYVAPEIDQGAIMAARHERGLGPAEKWVVCSSGGGMHGEDLTEQCMFLPDKFPGVSFDIVCGPRSRFSGEGREVSIRRNVRIWREYRDLALLHASADVVICRGGYNSLVEAGSGTAFMIVAPLTRPNNEEQMIHTSLLAKHLPIAIVSEPSEVATVLSSALRSSRSSAAPRRVYLKLNFGGVENTRRMILEDFGLEPC